MRRIAFGSSSAHCPKLCALRHTKPMLSSTAIRRILASTSRSLIRKGGIWSARVSDNCRALGTRDGGDITWFWIGTHRAYEKLIERLQASMDCVHKEASA